MSGYDGIAIVTSALQRLLLPAVTRAVPGSRVTTLRPDQATSDPQAKGANVWMHRAIPLPTTNSFDLPRRNAADGFVSRPSVALEVDYLITCLGDNAGLEPQKILGSVMVELQAHAVISARRLSQLSNVAWVPSSPVHLTRVIVSDPDLHWIWALYGSVPYMPTLIYRATTVVLQAQVEVVRALPVRSTRTGVRPAVPALVAVTERCAIGDTLVLDGNFPGSPSALVLSGAVSTRPIASATPTRITVVVDQQLVDDTGIRPGPCTVSIRFGDGDDALDTDAMNFALVATVTAVAASGSEVTVTAVPLSSKGRPCSLVLTPAGGGIGKRFGPIAIGDPESIAFDVGPLPAGPYLVQIVFSDVSSDLVVGEAGFDGPTVILGAS